MSQAEFYRSVGGVPLVRGGDNDIVWNFGIKRIGARETSLRFRDAAPHLRGAGVGKVVLLYEAARQVMGHDLDPGPQKIGDCVSWGWSGAVDLTACVQVQTGSLESFSWEERTCTEATYAFSRVEVGGQHDYSDGSTGEWAEGAVTRYGTLSRRKLGEYDSKRAKEWGAKGVPDEFEPLAKEHLIKTARLVTTYEEARDAIASGFPVPICSDVGFEGSRDKDGFIKRRGSWSHCMKLIASRDDARPGLLCMNSWGADTPDGPKGEYDIPGNSWWITPEDATTVLKQRDSYAISAFVGYPTLVIPWIFSPGETIRAYSESTRVEPVRRSAGRRSGPG